MTAPQTFRNQNDYLPDYYNIHNRDISYINIEKKGKTLVIKKILYVLILLHIFLTFDLTSNSL